MEVAEGEGMLELGWSWPGEGGVRGNVTSHGACVPATGTELRYGGFHLDISYWIDPLSAAGHISKYLPANYRRGR